MPIVLPSRLERILSRDQSLRSAVDKAFADFEPFMRESKLPFFPDYTDHGPTHIQQVLIDATSLMSDSALRALSPQDAAVLSLSALLHDSAMHISEDGFASLISGEFSASPAIPVDTKSWPTLWTEYVFEAQRWSERKHRDVIGEKSSEGQTLAFRIPPFDKLAMDLRDRLVIGEFLRRHHARLAHEIALLGVPGAGSSRIGLADHFGQDFADLTGFVARSHGIPLRSCLHYLERIGAKRVYADVHSVFLMAVLRIADYLQIQAERAPRQLLSVKRLRSPVSRGEWDAHLAVRSIHVEHDDPEAIMIHAQPENVWTYLRLKDWLRGIQDELDSSWAVLGEVYGRFPNLKKLALAIRRVRSNLDDVDTFAPTVSYVPERVEFTTSSPELLELLVRPLYGERPAVAIRELLQNAIDATRERYELERSRSRNGSDVCPASIAIEFEADPSGAYWLIVCDSGIGMTAATFRDYFLTAGASFRNSDTWQRNFQQSGTPSVLRTGRFGIGVLAAFLLGDLIEVHTRHLDEETPAGIFCRITLTDSPLEIRKVPRETSGTTIRVRIDPSVYDQLQAHGGVTWDWYRLSDPVVTRTLLERPAASLARVPECGATLPSEWRRLSVDGFDEVHWTYGRFPQVLCNGFVVGTEGTSQGYRRGFHWEGESTSHDPTIPFAVPMVSVFDRRGVFPLDVQRFSMHKHRYPFADALLVDVAQDFLAFCLVFGPDHYSSGSGARHSFFSYPGLSDEFYRLAALPPNGQWCFTPTGCIPLTHWHMAHASFETLVISIGMQWDIVPRAVQLQHVDAVVPATVMPSPSREQCIPMSVTSALGCNTFNTDVLSCMRPHAAQLLLPEWAGDLCRGFYSNVGELRNVDEKVVSVTADGEQHGALLWRTPSSTKVQLLDILSDEDVLSVCSGESMIALLERPVFKFTPKRNEAALAFSQFGEPFLIPYDGATRRSIHHSAFQALSAYVEKWQDLKERPLREVAAVFRRRMDKPERL